MRSHCVTRDRMLALSAGVCALFLSSGAVLAQLDWPSMYSDPAKYTLYGCPQLAQARPALLKRIAELEALMQKAARSTAGAAVSTMAYRGEYLAAKGDLQNLDARASDRDCPLMSNVVPRDEPASGAKPQRPRGNTPHPR